MKHIMAMQIGKPTPHPLKKRIENAGIKFLYIAYRVGVEETIFSKYLNGWKPMPKEVEQEVKDILKK